MVFPELTSSIDCDTRSTTVEVGGGCVPVVEYIARDPENSLDKIGCVILPGFQQKITDDPLKDLGLISANKFGRSTVVGFPDLENEAKVSAIPETERYLVLKAINQLITDRQWEAVVLLGFSLGGSLAVKLAEGYPSNKIKARVSTIISIGGSKYLHWLDMPYFRRKTRADIESDDLIVGSRQLRIPVKRAMDSSECDLRKTAQKLGRNGVVIHDLLLKRDPVVLDKESLIRKRDSLAPFLKRYRVRSDTKGLSGSDIHNWRGVRENRELLLEMASKILDGEVKRLKI